MKNVKKKQTDFKYSLTLTVRSLLILIILGFFNASLAAKENKVSIHVKDAHIEDVLKEIKKQTGLNYLLNHDELPEKPLVTVDVHRVSVEKALDQCLKGTTLSFEIIDGVILIKPQKNNQTKVLSQTIRGRVIDAETRNPLAFASVAIVTTEPMLGAVCDNEGYFRIDEVPVGRHDIKVSFVGYESEILPELLVSSTKELVLTLSLTEMFSKVDEITIKAYTKKDKPLNSMATLSARTFSVEEAQRFAAGFDDPFRLASSFAGVTTVNNNGNGLIIRGNAPKSVLWRLEGTEIPNPNHLPGFTSLGGGALSALSSLMLSNSDFFTGAFPAEYGNALSGVFDFNLRSGNNENHEHAVRIGTMGIDVSSEGPFSSKSNASYLFNYRYSTLALMQKLLPMDGELFPNYQDLCFNIKIPTKKMGIFSLWALATADNFSYEIENDTSKWNNLDDQESFKTIFRNGTIGLNHRYIFSDRTYLNSTLAITGTNTLWDQWYSDFDYSKQKMHHIDNTDYSISYKTELNSKFNARFSNRSGMLIKRMNYRSFVQYAKNIGDEFTTMVREHGSSVIYNVYSQFKINLSPRYILNAGFNSQYYDLSNEFLVEPRVGLSYIISEKQSLSIGYGKHSRLEPQYIYFAKSMENNSETYPNKRLRITKSHHLVLAYDLSINRNMRLKIEPYFQYLYDVPVIPDSSFSTINMKDLTFFTDKLTNEGKGTNFGIDFTLERFLNNGYYFLITASLFESKYVGGDNIRRNTRFNSNYAFNILTGKEWVLGASNHKLLGFNVRLNMMGGMWDHPVDYDYPYQKGDEVLYDYSKAFSNRLPDIYNLNVSVNYQINKKKHTGIWSVHVLNLLKRPEHYGYFYNYKEDKVQPLEFNVLFPYISYKIEF